MDFDVDELVDELKNLRKGYGVEATAMPSRLGRGLCAVCGVSPDDRPATVRRKVRQRLAELTAQLPGDLGGQARLALGLDNAAMVRYEARVAQLASQMDRDPRTARRRVDELLGRLAELALETEPQPASSISKIPWHTTRLQVVVILGESSAEVFETRRFVAHEQGLDEIDHSVTVIRPSGWSGSVDDLAIQMIHGAALGPPEPRGPRRLGFRLRLPRQLNEGEEHEFSFRVTLAQPFEPYYVCTPRFPCDRFELTVRFQSDRVPDHVWLLEDELATELSDPWPRRRQMQPNQVGEVRHEFSNLEPNRSYGIGWEPPAG